MRLRLAAPEVHRRPRPHHRAAGRPRRRGRHRHRRDDPSPRRRERPAGRRARRHCWPRRRRRWPTRRCATAARSVARSHTPIPAGDLLAPTLALDAEFEIAGSGGRRTVPAAEFFVDLFTTALGDDEILTERAGAEDHRMGLRTTRSSPAWPRQWSIVGVAAAVRVEGDSIAEARIGLTNMGSTPVRAIVRRAGTGRVCARRGRHRGRHGVRRRGHQPALRHQRRRRLQTPPRRRDDGSGCGTAGGVVISARAGAA